MSVSKNPAREAWLPASDEDRQVVHAELEEILASEHFCSSSRYPVLLRYIIEKTLQGDTDCLKERTIGIEVFHREPDYDTNDDPVVRFCAREVRKRIEQFYKERASSHPIELEIPPGGYVPQFWRKLTPESDEKASGGLFANGEGRFLLAETVKPSAAAEAGIQHPTSGSARSRRVRRSAYALAAFVLVLLMLAAFMWHRSRQARSPLMEVWGPLLEGQDAVLIDVGAANDLSRASNLSLSQHFSQPDLHVYITDISAISEMAVLLRTQKKQFRIHDSGSSGLVDFHKRPVILVGAYTNKWTVQFQQPLRFHFVVDGSLRYIQDAEHPESKAWNVNLDEPYLKQTDDYAVVGRFYCSSTGGPVVVVAGIGANGTEAAGEFIVSPEALATLAREAHSSLDKNFEAVLKVEVVGGNTGATTVIASQFW